jgi:hypothetical protein
MEVPCVLRLVEGPKAAQPSAHPSRGEATLVDGVV